MYLATLLLPLASVVFADTEASCDATDLSCSKPDRASGPAMLQQDAHGFMIMSDKLHAEDKRASCMAWCDSVEYCRWKACMNCGYCSATPPSTPPPTPTPPVTPPTAVWEQFGPDNRRCVEAIKVNGVTKQSECQDAAEQQGKMHYIWRPVPARCDVSAECTLKNGGGFTVFKKSESAPTPPAQPTPIVAPKKKKNVLVILTDDLNVDIQGFQYGHAQAYTPNIEKLAKRGTQFEQAYAQHPICVPSRASFITGIYGFITKSMFADKYWDYTIPKNSRTLVEHFSANGYKTYGTGKIGHKEKPGMFDVWGNDPDYGPLWLNEKGEQAAHPALKDGYNAGSLDVSFGRLSAAKPYIKGQAGWYISPGNKLIKMRYVDDSDRDPTPDEINADWAVKKLGEPALKDHVWFLAVGFTRPHTPLHALDKHFDQFPLESLKLPEIKIGDASDTHVPRGLGSEYYGYLVDAYGREEGLKLHLQAYLASIYMVDEQIGKVLDALDANSFSDSTTVVLLSDHGWHEGQKDVLWKNTPWEEATRIPLIIADPDYSGGQVAKFPVALIDVYPTLIDLCGLPTTTKLNSNGADLSGVSLKPLLENPSSQLAREGVLSVVSNYAQQWHYEQCNPCTNKHVIVGNPFNHHMTVRTPDMRYIWVADGTEELYNHTEDPYEWTNLIGVVPNLEDTVARHREILNIELADTGYSIKPYGDAKSAVAAPTYR